MICPRLLLSDDSQKASSNEAETLDPNAIISLKCLLPPDLEGGVFKIVEMQTSAGLATKKNSLNSLQLPYDYRQGFVANTITSTSWEPYYNFRLIPTVSSVSSNIGSLLGQRLTVYGSGFSEKRERISVFLSSGETCEISSVELNQIHCTIKKKSS